MTTRLQGVCGAGLALFFLLAGLWACGQQGAGWSGTASPGTATYRLQIAAGARVALPAGASLVADYGAFRIVEVGEEGFAALAGEPGVEARDGDDRILLNAGAIDTRQTPQLGDGDSGAGAGGGSAAPNGRRLWLVQYQGPIRPEWYADLAASGARVVSYIPNNSYLVWAEPVAVERLHGAAGVKWRGEYLDRYKLQPSVARAPATTYNVQLVEDASANEATLAAIRAVAEKEPKVNAALGYVNVRAALSREVAQSLASRPDVVSIAPRPVFRKLDERQDIIMTGQLNGNLPAGPGYLAWLASKGFNQAQFTASGFGVDLTDSGVDDGTQFPNHMGLYVEGNVLGTSRIVYNRLEGTPNFGSTLQGCDGHGNLNAHVIGGYDDHGGGFPFVDAAGYRYGLGVAPFVKIGSSVIFDPSSFTDPDYEDLISRAWRDGMRISSNSWGGGGWWPDSPYDEESQRYDALVRDAQPAASAVPAVGNQEMSIVFAAGNSGEMGGNTVSSPGTGKNVFTVGASENVQAFGQSDGCDSPDSEANSALDVTGFSSRGPCNDGRKKPDIMAPGSHVSGGVAQAAGQAAVPPAAANGQALACFDGEGVCGLSSGGHYFPLGQQWFTVSTGTSHSTPAVAGAVALLRQHFLNQGLPPPTPALAKAYFMNCARYMTGASANDTLPSNNQGMGLLDLGAAFDGVPRIIEDQSAANLFTATGQTRIFAGSISDASRRFAVTLAWTDAPGSTTGSAWKNNLDLTVTVGGQTYRGNVFSGAFSIPGGSADAKNNVESVILAPGVEGDFIVTVTAANINSDGVPGNSSPLDQDFALVIYNVCDTAPPAVTGVTATASGDNRIDVDWTANGAAVYRVYRATVAGGPYTRVAEVAGPPWADTTVSGGITYFYVVRGKECAESPSSNEASATATGICTLVPEFAGLESAQSAGQTTCTNRLVWSAATPRCGGAITYSVYRDTVAGFAPSAANRVASGLTGLSYDDDGTLTDGVTYHYVVRATETAAATVEESNTVQRSATVHGPIVAGVAYLDDFDAHRPADAAAYWTFSGTPANLAQLTNGCHYQTGTHAYRIGAANASCGGSYPANASYRLVLGGNGGSGVNGFAIPAAAHQPQMTFAIWYSLEDGWDGVYLAYSTVGASGSWLPVNDSVSATAPYIVDGLYDDTLGWSGTQRSWTGTGGGGNGALKQVSVNLDALRGRTVWLAFVFSSDSSEQREGFYVDDVRVTADSFQACVADPPGPPVAYVLSGLPGTLAAGTPATVDLRAIDDKGATSTGYSGTANLASTDPQATFPASVAFSAGVANGVSVTFKSLGAQSLTATDAASPSLTGSAGTTVTAGAPRTLQFVQQPASARAGEGIPVTVRVLDQFGNQTPVDPPAVALGWGSNPSGATLSGATSTTAAGGEAGFVVSVDKVGTGYTLSASAAGLTGDTSSAFDITAGDPSKLAFRVQPSDVAVGVAIAPAMVVELRDSHDNLTPSSEQVTLALSAGPAGASLSGTLTVTAAAGAATFDDVSVDMVGTGYRLTATAPGVSAAQSATFAVTSGPPDHLHFQVEPVGARAGAVLTPAVQVVIHDAASNVVAGATAPVSLALSIDGGATLSGTLSRVPQGGVATFDDLSVDKAGTYTLEARSGTLEEVTSAPFVVTAADPVKIAFVVQPSDAVLNGPVVPPIEVGFFDTFDNPAASSAQVTLALSTNPTGATLSGVLAVAAQGGVAVFGNVSLDREGAGYRLTASSAGVASVESAPFAVTSGVPDHLHFLVEPQDTGAGEPIAPAVKVVVHDPSSNVATGATEPVVISLADNPTGATLAGTLTAVPVTGVATFEDLSLTAAGTYTLRATSGGLGEATSASFQILAAEGVELAFRTQPHGVAAGVVLEAILVEVRDGYGNLATGAAGEVRLELAGPTVGAALGGTTAAGLVDGVATFGDLFVDRAGTGYTLVASVTGMSIEVSEPFDVRAGPAASLTVSLPASVSPGQPVSFQASALDRFGNPASDYAGTVVATSSDAAAVLPPASSLTFTGGQLAGQQVTFMTPGAATLTLTDSADPAVTGVGETTVSPFAAPTVQLTAPADGAEVARGSVDVTASATVAEGTSVQELRILVDGQVVKTGTGATLTASWDTSALAVGSSHELTATVTDTAGGQATSSKVTVKIGAAVEERGCGCGAAPGSGATALLPALAAMLALAGARRRGRRS